MGARNSRSKAKKNRKQNALQAQSHLTRILNDTKMPRNVRENATKHLIKTSSKNRLPLPRKSSLRICRKCKSLLFLGNNSRVRIRSGQRIITCLICQNIRRFGGGPKYHRGERND